MRGGQDLLGVERRNGDQLRNVAHIGWSTFGWTFTVNELEVPPAPPVLRLTSPSGELWEWGEQADGDAASTIEGSAEEFCQVVTQTRNIADVGLQVRGETAERWMEIAQCFAGPPETPPAPGTRRIASRREPLLDRGSSKL